MNRLWRSMVIVSLFLVGTAFLFASHSDQSNNLAGLIAWNEKHPAARECEMERLPINGEVGKKGLRVGLWGGEHISMEVTARRTTIEYDCAHATIDQRIALDRRGQFDVSGKQVREGGPVRQNELLNSYPVQFTGRVSGTRMDLTVKRRDNGELIGTFTLVYGQQASLKKCK
jgi:hypothetical protein